jgi:N-methylhydantoinase B
LPGKSTLRVNRGDRIHTQWCGGGGYGDPLEREPERVLEDVIEGKISVARARDVYGVVINVDCGTGRFRIDEPATGSRRAGLRRG